MVRSNHVYVSSPFSCSCSGGDPSCSRSSMFGLTDSTTFGRPALENSRADWTVPGTPLDWNSYGIGSNCNSRPGWTVLGISLDWNSYGIGSNCNSRADWMVPGTSLDWNSYGIGLNCNPCRLWGPRCRPRTYPVFLRSWFCGQCGHVLCSNFLFRSAPRCLP